ncbi:MAG: UDP-glucose 4-epimerase GalE [Synergistaceae bacterium]|nr:UDP-glucose 4-epimerase GalE [Candidatus Equadaptatus faecalis]
MDILVTGGAGFIGSHTVVALQQAGYDVIVADNFSNSKPSVLENIKKITGKDFKFYEADVTDDTSVEKIFAENKIDGVIHFAGYKAVGESVELPLKYYSNNLQSTVVLAEACIKHGCNKFVFSSSATVYGDNDIPFVETMVLKPTTNPYGETKAINERILTDTAKANKGFSVTLLRYFNPVGAHESGLIGEDPQGIPNNLMPYIAKVAKETLKELSIFGNDYPTRDGTCIRDYIHVMDLAEGHVAALAKMSQGVSVYNLGTGKGTSVIELVTAFEKANNLTIPKKFAPRRAGDLAEYYADAAKALRELGWKTKHTVEDMCRDAWRFEENNAK